MVKKGLIIEIKEDYSLAMTQDMEVLRIKNKKGLALGQKIYLLEEDLYSQVQKQERQTGRWLPGLIALAASLILIFTGLYYLSSPVIAGHVSIGTDEVIQLALDKDGQVLKLYDENGQELKDSALIGLSFQEASEEVLDQLDLDADENLVLASDMPDLADKIVEIVEEAAKSKAYEGDIIYLEAGQGDFKEARRDRRSLIDYLQDKYELNLWNKSEGEKLRPAQKEDRLKQYGRHKPYQPVKKSAPKSQKEQAGQAQPKRPEDRGQGHASWRQAEENQRGYQEERARRHQERAKQQEENARERAQDHESEASERQAQEQGRLEEERVKEAERAEEAQAQAEKLRQAREEEARQAREAEARRAQEAQEAAESRRQEGESRHAQEEQAWRLEEERHWQEGEDWSGW